MTHLGWRRWLSKALFLAGLTFLLAGLAFAALHVARYGVSRRLLTHSSLIPFFALAYLLLGRLVVRGRPHNPIGWLLLVTGALAGLNGLTAGYRAFLSPAPGAVPFEQVVDWLDLWVWMPGTLLPISFVLLLFPDGRLPSARWRWVGWTVGLGMAGSLLAVAFHPGPLETWGTATNPYGIASLAAPLAVFSQMSTGLLMVGLLGCILAPYLRWRRAQGEERQQLRWLGYAVGWVAVVFVVGSLVWFLWPDDPLATEVSVLLTSLAVLGVAGAVTVAVLRYRLYDIDLIINRTLVYGTLTAGVVAIYVLVVGSVSMGLGAGSSWVGLLLATAAVAVVVRPMHARIQGTVGRFMPVERPAAAEGRPRTPTTAEPAAPRPLTGRRWALGRLAWLAAFALAVSLWAVGTVELTGQTPISCASSPCDPFELSAEDLAVVQQLGLPLDWIRGFGGLTTLVFGLVFFAVGLLLFARARGSWLSLVASFTLVYLGAVFFTGSDDALWSARPDLRAPLNLVYALGFVALMLFLFHFPDGRFVPRSRRLQAVVLPLILLIAPFTVQAPRGEPLASALFVGSVGLGFAAQVHRYRKVSNALQRRQTRWVVAGLMAALLVMGLWMLAGIYFPPDQPSAERIYALIVLRLLITFLIPLLPMSIGLSILRYRLFDIDLILNRALVFTALTVFIVALYVVVVGAFGALSQASGNLLVSLLATGLAALLFQPLRERLQRRVNRLMYGHRDDPVTVFTHLGQRLQATVAPQALLPTLVETVAETLKLPYVAVEVGGGGEREVAAAYGLPAGDPVRLPLIHQGEQVGHLVVGTRGPDDPLGPADMRLLENIAQQAGTAVHAVRLTEALRRSRQQLVAAREEERRRLRRDLHDGLGPQLAAVTLRLDAARNLLRQDPEASAAVLEELKGQIQAAIEDIRRLVYDLRPPALDELGLVPALEEGAARAIGGDAPRVRVEAPEELPPLPAAVEVAAYRIALEAVTNALRHSQARRCTVRLRVGEALELEVVDDGVGLPERPPSGVGLVSMRERAEELGGECRVERRPEGGTRVLARLPLALQEV